MSPSVKECDEDGKVDEKKTRITLECAREHTQTYRHTQPKPN